MKKTLCLSNLMILFINSGLLAGELRIGMFDVDASPPIGSPMALKRIARC